MRHPVEKYNQIQAKRLAELPEVEREQEALLYRISNTAYCYQFQDVTGIGNDSPSIIVPEDLIEWLTVKQP